MLFFLCSLFSVVLFGAVSLEEELSKKIKNELELLDDAIQKSFNEGLGLMEKQFENLIEKSSELKNEAAVLIKDHSLNLAESFEIYSKFFIKNYYKNITSCSGNLDDTIGLVQEEALKKLNNLSNVFLSKIGDIIHKSTPVFSKIQNSTLELRELTEYCMKFKDKMCDYELILEKIDYLKEAITPMIDIVIDRLHIKINILESEINWELQKVVYNVVDTHSDILYDFIYCIM